MLSAVPPESLVMKAMRSILLAWCCGFALVLRAALPEPAPASPGPLAAPPPSSPAKFSAADLQKLAEPIALHPDPLLSVLLPASVYPVEIVLAARFVKDTNNIAKLDTQ